MLRKRRSDGVIWPSDRMLLDLYAKNGWTHTGVSEKLGISVSTLKSHMRHEPRAGMLLAGRPEEVERTPKQTVEVTEDTTIIGIDPSQLGDIEGLLKSRGLDPTEWIIVSSTLNEWDGMTKGGGVQTLRQLKVTLRRAPHLVLLTPAVNVTPLPKLKSKPKLAEPEIIVIEGDHQAPYFDVGLDAALVKLLEDTQPVEHVLLGDTCDFPSISRFKDEPSMASVQECIQSAYELLRRRREAAPNARCYKLKGNHDYRLESEMLLRAERLYGIRPADTGEGEEIEAMSIRRLLQLDALGIELVTDPRGWQHAEVELVAGPQGLVVRHGWLTGKNTARRSMDSRGRSLIVGHTHAREHVFAWDPATGCERQGVVCGTMSLVRNEAFPSFAVNDSWLQGVVVVSRWKDGRFGIEHARWDGEYLRWRDKSY